MITKLSYAEARTYLTNLGFRYRMVANGIVDLDMNNDNFLNVDEIEIDSL